MINSLKNEGQIPQKTGGLAKRPHSKSKANSLSMSHYSSDSVSISYKSKNGDELNIEVNHTEMKRLDLSTYSDKDKGDWQKIVEKIKDEYKDFKKQAVNDMLTDAGFLPQRPKDDEINPFITEETAQIIDKLPEMWKPEAVADRIFEFVTAYFGNTESGGEDFYKLAKDAISNGFSQASNEGSFDELPDGVRGVTEETKRVLFEKFDAWAKEKGILPTQEEGLDIKA
jgi:hypothetical protein